jgi:hypothetical protein
MQTHNVPVKMLDVSLESRNPLSVRSTLAELSRPRNATGGDRGDSRDAGAPGSDVCPAGPPADTTPQTCPRRRDAELVTADSRQLTNTNPRPMP